MMNAKSIRMKSMAGVTLLDVLLAIIIFAIGMLALSHMQGNLTRSSADANARTVATNIAEEIIENARSFVQVGPDPDGVLNTYAGIVDETRSYQRGGLNFDVTLTAQDYYFEADRVTLTTTAPEGRVDAYSDFKLLAVDVVWSTDQEFVVDEDATATLGTGSIRLTQLIPSIPATSGMMIASVGDAEWPGVTATHIPGETPDVVPVALDGSNSRFKETATPLPVVISAGEQIETWLDVVTYSRPGNVGDATFLRRDQYLAVSCECTLRIPSTADQGGFRPTVWTGVEHLNGEFVSKPYGEPATTRESLYCDQCCRDHHDGGTGANEVLGDDTNPRASYDPTRSKTYWDSGAAKGDHQHWGYNDDGVLTLAENDGDHYEEACRLVRVDGWMRVAQDAALQNLTAFPEGYLDYASGSTAYANFVVDAVEKWYLDAPAPFAPPSSPFPATSEGDAADIPSELGSPSQQLRARGIYIDYLTPEAEAIVVCMYDGGSGDSCGATGALSWLEVYPFFDVQLTWLSRWNEYVPDVIVDVTNAPVATDNLHDRGRAVLQPGATGYVTVTSLMHSGNLGLTATEAIDNDYLDNTKEYDLVMLASQDPAAPLVNENLLVSGTITSGVNGVKAASVIVKGNNALCSRSDVDYACLVQPAEGSASVTISNYYKANQDLWICPDVALSVTSQSFGVGAATTFALPTSGESIAVNFVIQNRSCGA